MFEKLAYGEKKLVRWSFLGTCIVLRLCERAPIYYSAQILGSKSYPDALDYGASIEKGTSLILDNIN